MAYWYDDTSARSNTSRRCIDFMMDDDSDVNSLPTIENEGVPQDGDSTLHLPVSKGSSALSISSTTLYFLNSQGEWVEQ